MPQEQRNRFPRDRRLKRQRLIRALFARDRDDVGQLRSGPVLIRYRVAQREDVGRDAPIQAGFAVGRAIGDRPTRNRIKRVMREAFRHEQTELSAIFDDRSETLTMMLVYRGNPRGASKAIRASLPEAMARLADRFDEASPSES